MDSQSTFLSRIGQMFWELLGYVTSAVQQYLTPAPPNTGNNDTNISPEARVCEEKNSDKEEEDNYLREETKRERKCWSHVNTADERVANLVQHEIVLSNQMESMSEQCMPVYVTSTEEEQVNQHPEKTVLEKAGQDKGDITQDIIKLGVEVEDTYIFANEQEKKTQHDKTTDDESHKSVDQRTEKKIELVEETDVRLPGDGYPFGEEDESKRHIKKERKSARKYEDLIQSNEVSVFRGHTEKHDVTEKVKGGSGVKEVVMTCEDMMRDSNGKTEPVAGETPCGEDKVLLSDTIDTREIEPGETADGVEEGQRSNEENERCTEESMGIESITKTSMGVLERGSKGEEMRGEWQGVQKSQRLETKKRSYKKDFAGANERDISYLYELRREDRLGEEDQKEDESTVGKNGEEYQPVQKEKADNRKKAEKEEKSYEEKQEAKIEGEFGSGIYGSFETAIKEVDVSMENRESDKVGQEEEKRGAEQNETAEMGLQERFQVVENEIKYETIMAGEGQDESRKTQMAGQNEIQREEESAEVDKNETQRKEKSKEEEILPESVLTLNMGQYERTKEWVKEEGDVNKLRDELDEEDHNQGSRTEDRDESDLIEESGEDGEWERCLFELEIEENNESEGMRDKEILHEERWREESKINQGVAESWVDVGKSVEANKEAAEENKAISGTEWRDGKKHEGEVYEENKKGREERSSKENSAGAEVSIEDGESDKVKEEEENRGAELNEMAEIEMQEREEERVEEEGDVDKLRDELDEEDKSQGSVTEERDESDVIEECGEDGERERCLFELEKEENNDSEGMRDTEILHEERWREESKINEEVAASGVDVGESVKTNKKVAEENKEISGTEWKDNVNHEREEYKEREREEQSSKEKPTGAEVGMEDGESDQVREEEENRRAEKNEMVEVEVQEKLLLMEPEIKHETIMAGEGEEERRKTQRAGQHKIQGQTQGNEVKLPEMVITLNTGQSEEDKEGMEEDAKQRYEKSKDEIILPEGVFTLNMGQFETEKDRVEEEGDVDKLRDELDEEDHNQGSVTENTEEADVIEEGGEDGERLRCLFNLENEEINDSEGMRDTEILHEERWREESKINEEVAESLVDVGESVEANKKVAEENKEISGTEWKDNINHEREDYKEREREERSSKEEPAGAEVSMEDGESDQVREEEENRRAEKNEMVEVEVQEKLLLMEPEIKHETIMAGEGEEERRKTQRAGQHKIQGQTQGNEVKLPEMVITLNTGQSEEDKEGMEEEGDLEKLRDELDEENKNLGPVTENIEESALIEEGGEDGERKRCLFESEKEENNDSEGMRDTEILHETRWKEESKIYEEVAASWVGVGESMKASKEVAEENKEISGTEWRDGKKHEGEEYKERDREEQSSKEKPTGAEVGMEDGESDKVKEEEENRRAELNKRVEIEVQEREKDRVEEEGDVGKLRDDLDEEDKRQGSVTEYRDEFDVIEESGEDGERERCLFELEKEENNDSEGMRDTEILHEERWKEESKINEEVAASGVDVGESVETNKKVAEENKEISGTEWKDNINHEREEYKEREREERSSKEKPTGAEVGMEDGESDQVREEEENRRAEKNEMVEVEVQEKLLLMEPEIKDETIMAGEEEMRTTQMAGQDEVQREEESAEVEEDAKQRYEKSKDEIILPEGVFTLNMGQFKTEKDRVEEERDVDKLRDDLDEENKKQGSVTENIEESDVIEEGGEDGERERCLFDLEKEENNYSEGMKETEILHEERWREESKINEEVAESLVDVGESVEANKNVAEENKEISGTEWKDDINHEGEVYKEKEREREKRSLKVEPTGVEVSVEDGELDKVEEEEENRRVELNERVEIEVQEREKERVEKEGDVDKLRDELDEENKRQGSVTEYRDESDVIEESGEDGERERCLFELEKEENNDSERMRDTEILHEERWREESKINEEVAASGVDVGESVKTNKKVAEENKEISGTEWKDNINHEREEYKEREREERSSKEKPTGAEVGMEDGESDQVREEEENRRAEKNEMVEVEVQEKLLLMEPEIKDETIMAGEEEMRTTQMAGQDEVQREEESAEVEEDAKQRYEKSKDEIILPEGVFTLNMGQFKTEKDRVEEERDVDKLRDDLDEENKKQGSVTENIEESDVIEEGGEDGERERCLFDLEKEENNYSEGMKETEILHEERWREESKINEEVAESLVDVGESVEANKNVAEENKEISGTEWKDDINHEGEVYKEKEREREKRSLKVEPTGVEVSVEDGELDKVEEEEENRRVELNERVEIEVQEREKERVEKEGDVDKLRDELDEENKRQGSVTEYRDESDVIEESGEDGERERCLFELEKEENNDSERMRDTEILHEERWREESKINEEVAASGVDVGESVKTNKKVAEENKEISGTEWKDNINHEREEYKEREREERSSKEKPTGAEVGMEDGESDQVREEEENRRAEKNEMVEVEVQEKPLLMEPEIKDETIMAGEEEMRTTQMAGQDEVQREEESAEVEEDAKQRYEKSKDEIILPEGVFTLNMGQFKTEKDRVEEERDVDKLRDDLDEENKKQGSVTENIEESDVIEEGGEDGERERCLFDLEKEENNDSEGMKKTEILHEERWREESKINEEVTASWIDVGESETCEVNVQNKAEEKNVEISVTELRDDRKHRENVYEVKEQEIIDISTEEQPYENFNIFHEALDMSKENETKIDLQETKESRIHEDNIFGRNSHVTDLFKVAEELETKKEERDNECLEKQPTILIVGETKDEGHVSDENVDIKTMEEGDGMDLNVAPATKSELIEGFSANVEKEGITLRDGWAIEKTKETRNNDGSQSGDTPYALDRGGIRGAESGRDINECTMRTTEGQRPKIQLKIEKGVKLEEDENFTNAKEIQSQFSDAKLHKTSEHGKLWAETAGQSRTRIVNEETDGNEGRKHITKDGPGKKRLQKRTHENEEEEFNLQLDSPSLDFTAQKSRIALKNRHVRAPKDPRILLQIPSLSPTSAPPTLVEEAATKPVGIKVGGVGMMGFKLPGIGAGFPVLKKTERRVEERREESTGQMTMKAPTPNLGPDDSEPAATKKWAAGSVGVMLPGFGPGMPALRKTDKGVKLIEKSTDDATVPHGKHDTSSGGGAERNGEESKEKGVKSVGPSTIKLPSFGAGFPVLRKTEMGSKLRGKEGKTSEAERNETENNQPEKPGSDSPMLVSELKKRFMKTERK